MAQLSRTTKCKYCGKDIAFIKTEKGKSMPVDPEAVEFIPASGFEKYVLINGAVESGAKTYDGNIEQTHIGYRSHFATCQYADKAHKKNKSERTREV